MSSGDSHTNFNAGAFGLGAVAGAATIAGALVAGVERLRAQRQQEQAEFLDWEAHQLRAGLVLSEAFRANDHRVIQDLRITVARHESELAIEQANRKLGG